MLLMSLMISLASLYAGAAVAREEHRPRRRAYVRRVAQALYRMMCAGRWSNWRLYSWMRFTCESNNESGFTIWPVVALSHCRKCVLASRFALRKPMRKSVVLGQRHELAQLRQVGDPAVRRWPR